MGDYFFAFYLTGVSNSSCLPDSLYDYTKISLYLSRFSCRKGFTTMPFPLVDHPYPRTGMSTSLPLGISAASS